MKALFIILLGLSPIQTQAAVLYVSQSDTGSHFPSISAGIAAAATGDTICVYPGTYTEPEKIIISKKLCIEGRDSVTIDRVNARDSGFVITVDSVRIINLRIENSKSPTLIALINADYCFISRITSCTPSIGGILLHNSNNVAISACSITGKGGSGCFSPGEQNAILIDNSQKTQIHNCTFYINQSGSDVNSVILGSICVTNPCYGIRLSGQTPGTIIRNCLIAFNDDTRICFNIGGCITGFGYGIAIDSQATCLIESCDIYGNGTRGCWSTSDSGITAVNNWWGSWHGPRFVDDTTTNPYYQETVSGDISYTPWAIAPYFPELWDSLSPLLPGETGINDRITDKSERIMISPMPFRTGLRIQSHTLTAGTELPVYDRAGRMVTVMTVPRTVNELCWDGTRSDGTALPSGIYFINIGGTLHKIIRSE